MRKKTMTFTVVIMAVVAMVTAVSVFAWNPAPVAQAAPVAPVKQAAPMVQTASLVSDKASSEQGGGCDLFTLMFDENGKPVSKDALKANLDKAIEDGYIEAEDKDFFIELYSFCVTGDGQGFGCGGFGGCPLSR